MPIDFIEGHYYRWIGPKNYKHNNFCPEMKPIRDGIPRKCLKVIKGKHSESGQYIQRIVFEGIDGGDWYWGFCSDLMDDCGEDNVIAKEE